MSPKELLQNLLIMAASDGSLHHGEIAMLADRCAKWGITDDEFETMIEGAVGKKAVLQLPPDSRDRENLLRELIHMMGADGQLSETEKRLFATAAAVMKISLEQLDRIIDEAVGS